MKLPILLTLVTAALAPLHADGWTVVTTRTTTPRPLLAVIQQTVVKNKVELTMEIVRFNAAAYSVHVVDDPAGTRSPPALLAAAGCVAAVNGGYFHSTRTPLGLVVSNGKQIHPLEHASLLSGLIRAHAGSFVLSRLGEAAARRPAAEVLQSGPFLVDGGHVVPGLEKTRMARRTAIATDAQGMGALLISDALTLEEFGLLLATPGIIPGLRISRALNLDGGSSTLFWSAKPAVYSPGFAVVRNYVGLVPLQRKRKSGEARLSLSTRP